MLRLRVDPDSAPQLGRQPRAQLEDLVEGRDLEAAVVLRVGGAQLRDALARPQGLELGEAEVLGEPARQRGAVDRLRRAAAGELRVLGDVCRARDLVLVARDEDTVAGADE